ncbi:MAG: hypothetical protein R3E79_32895 [Caldilineaceae bacterium]
MNGVAHTMRIQEQHKLTNCSIRPDNTIIHVGNGVRIGSDEVIIMAGPCSVESRDQIVETAIALKAAGAKVLRLRRFQPCTSPYDFQGLGEEGLKYLAEAREITGLPIITEVMTVEQVPLVTEYADILQIGARNMQNYGLLNAAGKSASDARALHERLGQRVVDVRRVHCQQWHQQHYAFPRTGYPHL